jgi:RNA polymerase sigma factor (sigma-70 family)
MTAIEFNHHIIGYENKMQRFAYSLVLDKDEANDLVQETFLKALLYREKLSDYSNLRVWIMTIMRNIFINNYRRTNKGRDIINEKVAISKDLEHGFESTDSYFSQNEINKAFDQLTDDLKEPFLKFVDGFKYREIADETGLNIGTVKSRIHTARQQLMQSLKDFKS